MNATAINDELDVLNNIDTDAVMNASRQSLMDMVFDGIRKGLLPDTFAMKREVRKINKRIKEIKFAVNFATPFEIASLCKTMAILEGRKSGYNYFIKIGEGK
ncbi:MAG: hypothetical protein IKZ92_03550 [Muribaculaceae bacterium]|nr:hypothetical protein [Muribaculaceae bacterium]